MSAPHPDIDQELGMKRLTPENWLDVDPASAVWVTPNEAGFTTIQPQDWTEQLLAVQLDEQVPLEIRRLFAVARGLMLYGSFFYPLWAVGQDRLFVVADAAVRAKYEAEGGARTRNGRWPTYKQRLDWLLESGVLDEARYEQWDLLRELRNQVAHPETQSVYPPSYSLRFLTDVARDINALFCWNQAGPQRCQM